MTSTWWQLLVNPTNNVLPKETVYECMLSECGFYLSTTSSVVLVEVFEELGLVQALWPFVIMKEW